MPLLRRHVPHASLTCGLVFVAACSTFTSSDLDPTAPDAALDADPADASNVLDAFGSDGTSLDAQPQDYASAVLASNPLRYFRFEEGPLSTTFADSTGTAAHATAQGAGITSGAPGAITNAVTNNAVTLAGNGSYLDCGDLLALQTADNFAIEVWIEPDPGATAAQAVVTNIDPETTTVSGFALRIMLDRTVQLTVSNAAATFTMMSTNKVPASVWTHLAVSYGSGGTGAKVAMWINGTAENVMVSGDSSGIVPQGGPLRLGLNAAMPVQAYSGRLDEVALYSHPLTDDDIQRHRAGLSP